VVVQGKKLWDFPGESAPKGFSRALYKDQLQGKQNQNTGSALCSGQATMSGATKYITCPLRISYKNVLGLDDGFPDVVDWVLSIAPLVRRTRPLK
jgi:hypothetical protein